jgi:hypothetical protein
MNISNNDKDKEFRIQCLFELRKNMIYDMSIGLGDSDIHSQFIDSYGVSLDLLHNIERILTAEYARHVYSNHVKKLKLRLEEKGLNPDDINLIHFLMQLYGKTKSSFGEEGEGGEVVLLDKAEQLRRADLVRNRKAYPCIYCNALDDKDESKTSKVEYFKHIKTEHPNYLLCPTDEELNLNGGLLI